MNDQNPTKEIEDSERLWMRCTRCGWGNYKKHPILWMMDVPLAAKCVSCGTYIAFLYGDKKNWAVTPDGVSSEDFARTLKFSQGAVDNTEGDS